MLRLKKEDTIKVIAGKDKGKKGKVLKVFPQRKRLLVERINLVKKHMRRTQADQKGGVVEKEMPLEISNVMLVCRHCNKATRIGTKILKDNSKARMCRKCKEVM
ncbi:50S ribosomal protein L24 [Candidatus Omnitrophota bacterium]